MKTDTSLSVQEEKYVANAIELAIRNMRKYKDNKRQRQYWQGILLGWVFNPKQMLAVSEGSE